MTSQQIIDQLITNESVELQTADDILIIWFRKFFGPNPEFHFQFNAKPVFGCKTKKTAIKKIEHFMDRGFNIVES